MANRYIRHGASYCGDGTSPELAASNGGVGAWNNINVFSGSAPAYGTLPAGTTVFIRSKDVSGGAVGITSGSEVNLGSPAATADNQINWVIDGGTVWSGISGVVTVAHTASAWMNLRAFNNFITEVDSALTLKIAFEATGGIFAWINKCYTKGLCIDFSATPNGAPLNIFEEGTHDNLKLIVRKMGINPPIYLQSNSTVVNLYNPTILLNEVSLNTSVFYTTGNGAEIRVYGGSISGPGATSGVRVFKSSVGGFMSHGLVYPKAMALSSADFMPNMEMLCFATGADGRLGTDFFDPFFSYTSRADLNPPTLNASFGDSANSGWSWKVHPYNVSVRKPAKLTTSKLYTQAASSKTVTQEFLWPSTLAVPSSDAVWMVIEYTNTSGVKVTQSTRSLIPGSVASSTAGWSAATWGAASFGKYKLSLTTASAIKQDTEVMVTFFCTTKAASNDDILFVCPDPTFSS